MKKARYFTPDAASMPATNNAYEPLHGFYGSPMYHWIIDDYGNAKVSVWPMLDLIESEIAQ